MTIAPPDLTFACELEAQPLKAFFDNPDVIPFLQVTGAAVSLGILDLSEQRAEVVRFLNQAGVPVTAWLLLPKDQGYWFNLDNHPQAAARYEQFKAWSMAHDLHWDRIGLDIEPDIRTIQMLSTNRIGGIKRLLRSALNTPRLLIGRRAYQALIQQIHLDGFSVETYHFPFIIDERQAHSNLLQRLTGLVDLPETDREVLMLYTSFLRPWGQGVLWSYAPRAQGIGIGSTGGGVDLDGSLNFPPLNWVELQTDLLLARRHSENIFIFSLEGCVRQNFLPLLQDFDWQQPVQIPYSAAQRAEDIRGIFQRILWLAARPAWILFSLALLISTLALLFRRKRSSIE